MAGAGRAVSVVFSWRLAPPACASWQRPSIPYAPPTPLSSYVTPPPTPLPSYVASPLLVDVNESLLERAAAGALRVLAYPVPWPAVACAVAQKPGGSSRPASGPKPAGATAMSCRMPCILAQLTGWDSRPAVLQIGRISMGVTGLLPQLKSIVKPVHVREYAGQTVCIDGYSWLHKGAYCCARELCEGVYTDK